MNSKLLICVCTLLTACSQQSYTESIDRQYVKDCNDRGGKVERIDYTDVLQCIGATTKDISK
jgi:hypothetical protein